MKKFIASTLVFAAIVTPSLIPAQAKSRVSSYGPTAMCRDGSYSYSKHHRGTCSWHGGVSVWYK